MALSFGFATNAVTNFGNTVTTTGGTTQTVASTFVVFTGGNSGSVTSVTDNKGNTYTQKVSGFYNASNQWLTVWVSENGVGGSGHTVTVNYGSTSSNGAVFVEVLGGATLDVFSAVADTSTPSITTNAADAVLSFNVGPNFTTYTAVSDTFANILTSNLAGGTNGIEFALGGKIQTSAGTISDTFTYTPANTAFGQVIVGFKPRITYTQYGPYNNTGGPGTTSLSTGTINYVSGQPIVVEASNGNTSTISDTAGLTWVQFAFSTGYLGSEKVYAWYALPTSSGSTVITVSQGTATTYFAFRAVAYTANAGTPTNVSYQNSAPTGSAVHITATITPTTVGSVVWLYNYSGNTPTAPTPDAGTTLYSNYVIVGWDGYYVLGPTSGPVTSLSPVTIGWTTTTDFQYENAILYEVPFLLGSGGGGGTPFSVAFFKF